MEIPILILLFLVGSLWGGVQALRWFDHRRMMRERRERPPADDDED